MTRIRQLTVEVSLKYYSVRILQGPPALVGSYFYVNVLILPGDVFVKSVKFVRIEGIH